MIPIFWIGVGLWVTFYCYSLQKPFLRASEDQWTPGQIFPTCFVVIGSVAELWNIFNMDGKAPLLSVTERTNAYTDSQQKL